MSAVDDGTIGLDVNSAAADESCSSYSVAERLTSEAVLATDAAKEERNLPDTTLPYGAWLFERAEFTSRISQPTKRKIYQASVVILTYLCYTSYHMNRKPLSVVKSTLHPDCDVNGVCANPSNSCRGWKPFDEDDGKTLLGTLDYAWLFSYAIAMFFSGQLADRSNLRYFLAIGMLGSALSSMLFGLTYFLNIHQLFYFILIQVLGGTFQASGFPVIITAMSNWFGKGRRGLIMGMWYTHNQVGSMLGSVIPAVFAHNHWGYSFIVAALVMVVATIIVFLFLVTDPAAIGLPPPQHHLEEEDHVMQEGEDHVMQEGEDHVMQEHVASETTGSGDQTSVSEQKAISLWKALCIPGVLEFSLAHFFAKMVSYSFLLWLPFYIKNTRIGSHCLTTFQSGALSTAFDVGGIIGSVVAGLLSDVLRARAVTITALLYLSIPMIFIFKSFGDKNLPLSVVLIVATGAFVIGPHAIITSAVSADLGTHRSLKGNRKAKSTVTGLINGIGSTGAAFGPLLTGVLSSHEGWDAVFYLFMSLYFASGLSLTRLTVNEMRTWKLPCLHYQSSDYSKPLLVSESGTVPSHQMTRFDS